METWRRGEGSVETMGVHDSGYGGTTGTGTTMLRIQIGAYIRAETLTFM